MHVLPFKQHEENILLGAKVLHRGCPSTNLTPQDVVENLRHIFFTLVVTGKYHMNTSVHTIEIMYTKIL